jgi:hypothetical protein
MSFCNCLFDSDKQQEGKGILYYTYVNFQLVFCIVGKFLNINSIFVSFTKKDFGGVFHVSKLGTKDGKNLRCKYRYCPLFLKESWILQLENIKKLYLF